MSVTIYSTPSCPYCTMAKSFFKEKHIPFTDYDVSRDERKASEMIRLTGQRGVPVIKMDNQVVVGFDRTKIEKLIKK